jgi:dTMP kinase
VNELAGRLIALEGIDGSGKSTQAQRLANALGALCTFEPGATDLGQALRVLMLEHGRPELGIRAEALMMAADRAQHVEEVIRPALVRGQWVVTDRFSGSTLAYQGWGRGLGSDGLRQLVSWAAAGVEPDLNVLVDVTVEVGRARRSTHAGDRLEVQDTAFYERVRHGFSALAASDPEHWVVVDGSTDPEAVESAIVAAVIERLGSPQ